MLTGVSKSVVLLTTQDTPENQQKADLKGWNQLIKLKLIIKIGGE